MSSNQCARLELQERIVGPLHCKVKPVIEGMLTVTGGQEVSNPSLPESDITQTLPIRRSKLHNHTSSGDGMAKVIVGGENGRG